MRRSSGVGLALALCLPLVLIGSSAAVPGKGFAGRFDLKPASADMGGFSALWVAPLGDRLIALSDRSYAVTGRITRDRALRITTVTLSTPIALRGREGQLLAPGQLDSEGIAVGPDGALYISTEGPARVLRTQSLGGVGQQVGTPADFGKRRPNGALESLAIDAMGRLYTLPETTAHDTGPFPLYRRDGTDWRVIAQIPRSGDFLPVSADIGPDGRLYLLFRAFGGLSGFATRLQRFELAETGPGPAETLIETAFGLHGNLEGLSIWRDARSRLTATMIADDNQNFFQSADLVEYHLPD